MIEKIQSNTEAFKIKMFYYKRARDAMYDAVSQLVKKGYKDIYIQGHVGWSPREGSINPLNSIKELNRFYYRLTKELSVDFENLKRVLKNNSILKEDMREVFINTYKVIDKTKEIARNKNIDLNDIESLNRMCNRVILEIKDDIRKNSKPIPLWLNHEAPITSDVLSLILLEWLYKHIEETNVTKEQAKKDITVKISELINKL